MDGIDSNRTGEEYTRIDERPKKMIFKEYVSNCLQAGMINVIEDEIRCSEIPFRVLQEERKRNRPLLFNHVVGSPARVVANLFHDPRMMCKALGMRTLPQLFGKLDSAIARPMPIRRKTIQEEGSAVIKVPDLTEFLPLIKYSQDDATPYLTSGIILVREPESGGHHVCFVRISIKGENQLVINPATPRIRRVVEATVGQGRELDIVILIGPPVEIILMACLSLPKGADKLEVAQALVGDTLAFSGGPLPVPLGSEYVLKGRVVPHYEREGPFGDLKGLYSLRERNPLCLIDELHQRKDPLFHSVSAGVSREHVTLVTMGPRLYLERLKRNHSSITKYELPRFGGGRVAVLAVNEAAEPEQFLDELWKIPIVRAFVFVNRDVDTRSASDLFWAILQRAKDRENFQFSEQQHPVFQERKIAIDAMVKDLSLWDNRRVKVFQANPDPE